MYTDDTLQSNNRNHTAVQTDPLPGSDSTSRVRGDGAGDGQDNESGIHDLPAGEASYLIMHFASRWDITNKSLQIVYINCTQWVGVILCCITKCNFIIIVIRTPSLILKSIILHWAVYHAIYYPSQCASILVLFPNHQQPTCLLTLCNNYSLKSPSLFHTWASLWFQWRNYGGRGLCPPPPPWEFWKSKSPFEIAGYKMFKY